MTTALVLTASLSLGVIGSMVALAIYQSRLLSKAFAKASAMQESWKTEVETGLKLQRQLAEFQNANEKAMQGLKDKEQEAQAEREARKKAEEHRDQLLVELAKTGDPRAVAARIREELKALTDLGQPKPGDK